MDSICALYGDDKGALTGSSAASPLISRNSCEIRRITMPKSKWYSPRLRRDLVTRLYFRAEAERIPMTRLADRLIEEALARPAVVHEEFTSRLAEEPPKAPVPG
jgi:hypothetical protein